MKGQRILIDTLASVLLLALTVGPARAQGPSLCGYNLQINIAPALPTPDDTIQITPSGDWPDMCIPSYQSHQVMGNVIRIDAIVDYPPGTFCPYVITPWEFTVDVGNLPGGSYRADVYITNILDIITLCGTRPFTVSEGQEPEYDEFVFLPLIICAWPPTTLTVIGEQSVWAEDIEWHIVGEVYNGTPYHLINVGVPVDIFDSDGRLIDTDRGWAAVSPLGSGDKTCFRVDIYPDDMVWSYYVLGNPGYSFVSEQEPVGNLVVYDVYGEYHPYFDGRMYKILGWVRNDNPFKVYYVDANVTLYNAEGVVIGCGRWNDISTPDLDPGQESSFEVNIWDWSWNSEDIAYYRIQMDASR